MSGIYVDNPDERADELHDARVQRELDEQWHAEILLRQQQIEENLKCPQ